MFFFIGGFLRPLFVAGPSYHYNKEEVEDGTAGVRYTHTATNYSDATTKGLGPIKVTCRQFNPVLHGYELPNPLLRKC